MKRETLDKMYNEGTILGYVFLEADTQGNILIEDLANILEKYDLKEDDIVGLTLSLMERK